MIYFSREKSDRVISSIRVISSSWVSMKLHLWIIPVALMCSLFIFVTTYAVNFPVGDSLAHVEMIAGIEPLTLDYLWKLHNEHRIVWQKLFEFYWGKWTHWNVAWQTYFTAAFISIGSLLILLTAKRSSQFLNSRQYFLLITSLSFWLFTFNQSENLIRSFQISWGFLFLIFVLFSLSWKRFSEEGKGGFFVSTLIFAASLTSAHGLVLPIFVVGYTIFSYLFKVPVLNKTIWVSMFSLTLVGFYLYGYERPGQHDSPLVSLTVPHELLLYFSIYIGNSVHPIGRDWGIASLFVFFNLCFFSLFGASLYWQYKRNKFREFWNVYSNHILLTLGVLVMLMIAVGRIGFGFLQAAAGRYVTFSLLLQVGAWLYILKTFNETGRQKYLRYILHFMILTSSVAYMNGFYMHSERLSQKKKEIESFVACIERDIDKSSICFDQYNASQNIIDHEELLTSKIRTLKTHKLSCFYDN